MKIFIIFISLFLSSCVSTAVPVQNNFPNVPNVMMEECEKLKKIDQNNITLSEIVKSVVNNYSLYHECSLRNTIWIEWYKENKEIFNLKK